LVLAASVRHDGKSLGEIARVQLGRPAALIASVAILFIVIIALAGLSFVVVKALGGEEAKLPAGMTITPPPDADPMFETVATAGQEPILYRFPAGCRIRYSNDQPATLRAESFQVKIPFQEDIPIAADRTVTLP